MARNAAQRLTLSRGLVKWSAATALETLPHVKCLQECHCSSVSPTIAMYHCAGVLQ